MAGRYFCGDMAQCGWRRLASALDNAGANTAIFKED